MAHAVLKCQDCHRGHQVEATVFLRDLTAGTTKTLPAVVSKGTPGYAVSDVRTEGTRDSLVRS